MTATTASEAFIKWAAAITTPYPHSRLNTVGGAFKKQSTRLIKAHCPHCGYVVRVTRTWLLVGAPICPTDRIEMIEE